MVFESYSIWSRYFDSSLPKISGGLSRSFNLLFKEAFFGFNFLVPPIRFIYEKFLKGFINQATEKVMEIQAQIIERMNDAQRKVSDRMTAV